MSDYAPNFFPADKLQFTAAVAITAGQLVYVSAPWTVSPTSAATAAWVGIAQHDVAAGDPVPLYLVGVHTVAAVGAIAAGAAVIAAAGGGVATVGADASDGANIVGLALSAAAGGFVTILIR
jgi:hypothetical protein